MPSSVLGNACRLSCKLRNKGRWRGGRGYKRGGFRERAYAFDVPHVGESDLHRAGRCHWGGCQQNNKGKIQAHFIPGTSEVEAYLKNNLACLKQNYDNEQRRIIYNFLEDTFYDRDFILVDITK